MFCPNCGNYQPDGTGFCTCCGTKLNTTQPVYSAPNQPVYQPPATPEKEDNSKIPGFVLSIPAMIAGIISIAGLSPAFGIAGIIMSAISISKGKAVGKKHKMAVAGLICSIIGVIVGTIATILLVVYYIALFEEFFYGGSYSYF